jgi:hypothetical protein
MILRLAMILRFAAPDGDTGSERAGRGPPERNPGKFRKRLILLVKSWLGREDSNLRMVESKSARILNDFNGFSDETTDSAARSLSE